MTHIDASGLDYRQLNAAIRSCSGDASVTGCYGQRFIGAGLETGNLTVTGTPGNALGAYLDGACIEVRGNAQDAVGDTMNAGRIVVRGSIGDAAGYAMRGGELYVEGNAGYRAGIHMKAYGDKRPVMVIGGKAGSFLGEYQAGGVIIVLGLKSMGICRRRTVFSPNSSISKPSSSSMSVLARSSAAAVGFSRTAMGDSRAWAEMAS